jgi:hypothetical protein
MGGKKLIYTNFRKYVDIEGKSITTTDMWMDICWQSGAIVLIKLLVL